MILLHPYTPGFNDAGQSGCREFFQQHESELMNWTVMHCLCDDPYAYERYLLSVWGQDLIIVEHDIVPTVEMLISLAECPHPLCVQAYKGNKQFVQMKDTGEAWEPITEGDEWCDIAGLGLVRISKGIQEEIGGWEPGTWNTLDIRMQHHIHKIFLPQYRFMGSGRSTIMVYPPQEVNPGGIVRTRSEVNSPDLVKIADQGPRWHVHWPQVRHDH